MNTREAKVNTRGTRKNIREVKVNTRGTKVNTLESTTTTCVSNMQYSLFINLKGNFVCLKK